MVWPAVDENAAPAQSSCQLGPVVKEAALEDCVESQQAPQPPQRFSRKRRASTMESFDGSCSGEATTLTSKLIKTVQLTACRGPCRQWSCKDVLVCVLCRDGGDGGHSPGPLHTVEGRQLELRLRQVGGHHLGPPGAPIPPTACFLCASKRFPFSSLSIVALIIGVHIMTSKCSEQAKRARHIGSFDDPLKAARAYDREAARSTPAVPMAPLSEVKRAPEPASGNENFRPISIQQQRYPPHLQQADIPTSDSEIHGRILMANGHGCRHVVWCRAVKGVARAPGVRPARGSSRGARARR